MAFTIEDLLNERHAAFVQAAEFYNTNFYSKDQIDNVKRKLQDAISEIKNKFSNKNFKKLLPELDTLYNQYLQKSGRANNSLAPGIPYTLVRFIPHKINSNSVVNHIKNEYHNHSDTHPIIKYSIDEFISMLNKARESTGL